MSKAPIAIPVRPANPETMSPFNTVQTMKLYQHQKDGLERGKQGNCLFAWSCGTGKTLLGLSLIDHFRRQGEGPALVVCPLSIVEPAWLEDARRFFPHLRTVSLWDKKPAVRRQRLTEDFDMAVVNFEGLKSLFSLIAKRGFSTLVVDESSRMKSHTSQTTQALMSLAGFFKARFKAYEVIPHRYCLSGTPAPNDESEYWSQVKFVAGPGDHGFHDNYYVFRSNYFRRIPLGLTGQAKHEFLASKRPCFMDSMAPYCDVVRKEDVLDLPDQIHQIRQVNLAPDERRAYDELKTSLVLRFENQVVLAETALTEVMKLRQLSSGFVYDTEGDPKVFGDSKLKENKRLLEEIGDEQVIIWAQYRTEIHQLLDDLSESVSLYGGTADKQASIEAFKSGRAQYLIAHPQTAGHGLTFVNCSHSVYYSLDYSLERFQQSQNRIHRIGQRRTCIYHYLLAENSIDSVIYRALHKKGDMASAALAHLRGTSNARKKVAV
jgi:SNF2 family DNA or RNA helicase